MSARRPRNGFVLIATCIALIILMALAGLAVDIGRMHVIKSELQAFTDAAALSAAICLDGTDSGLVRARQSATELTTGPSAMKWDMGTQPVTDFKYDFAPDAKSWQSQPKDAANYRYARVIATAPAPLIFLRPFVAFSPEFANVAAASAAENTPSGTRLVQ